MRFPPPVDDPLFSTRGQAASYLGAWGLTATHLILWLLIAIGLLTSEALVIGVSLLSFAATCLLIGMVIAAHRLIPVIGVLVYLIVRGGSMSERAAGRGGVQR